MLEPFVFIAILALFIEFPSIQDLIYTKICLQVLTEHQFNSTTTLKKPVKVLDSFIEQGNLTLPSSGRIQALDVHARNSTSLPSAPLTNISNNNTTDLHSICSRANKSVPRELRQEILDLDSLFWLKYQLVICTLCAFASPYWGGISDKIGRFIPLNVPIFASLLCNLISLAFGVLISMESHDSFHINWLYGGALLVGLSGGQPVLISNSFSFLSDNTTSDNRTKRVTILESVIFLAHSLGFFLSKLMMSLGLGSGKLEHIVRNRHFVAFGTNVLLNLVCLVYSSCRLRHRKFHRFLNNYEREQQEAVVSGIDNQSMNGSPRLGRHRGAADNTMVGDRLRELTSSTPDDLDGPVARADKSNWTVWDTIITFRYYKETYSVAMKPRQSRHIILLLLLVSFISALSLATLMSLFFVFVKMDPFNWTSSQYSEWNSISAISRGIALVSLTLCMKFYSRWSVPDPLVAALGFLGKFSGLLLIGLAQQSNLLYWSLACFTISEYAMPPIRSLLSKLVIQEELCKVYSFMGSLQSVCFILGNIAFYIAFNYTVTRADYFRLTFIISASLEFVALLIMLLIYTSLRRRTLVI